MISHPRRESIVLNARARMMMETTSQAPRLQMTLSTVLLTVARLLLGRQLLV